MEPNKIIIDSDLSESEALAQARNPQNPAPDEILNSLQVLAVSYRGFDDLLHNGQIIMHKDVIEDMQKFFDLALSINFPIKTVIPISNPKYKWNDEYSCDDNNTSGFNYRLVAGTNRMSKHATGFAFDVNPGQNIYVKYDSDLKEIIRFPVGSKYDTNIPGTLTSNNSLVLLMKSLDWDWGGDWTPESGRIDYQHFEKNIKI